MTVPVKVYELEPGDTVTSIDGSLYISAIDDADDNYALVAMRLASRSTEMATLIGWGIYVSSDAIMFPIEEGYDIVVCSPSGSIELLDLERDGCPAIQLAGSQPYRLRVQKEWPGYNRETRRQDD